MILRIITPASAPLRIEVSKVFFPGMEGSFEVLHGHAAMVAALEGGSIKWVDPEGKQGSLAIRSGFVQVENDVLDCCVEQ